MRAWLSVPDRAGCGHYRVIYPGRVAEELGVAVEFKESITLRISERGKVIGLPKPDCDVLVISRPLRRINVEAIPFIQRHGIAVVVDIDDDFSCVDPRHQAWKWYQPEHSPDSNRRHLARACAMADLVTCTTPALAKRYGAHGRVAVLPNCIPEDLVGTSPSQPRTQNTVGWPGHTQIHPGDLQATRGGVADALRETGARFMTIGNGKDVAENLELSPLTDLEVTGSIKFEDYLAEVARLDLGIVPLAPSRFNEAKSGLKGLEMAAVGVPFVASDLPDYQRLALEGIGVLARSRHKDWYRRVKQLLRDRSLREELAQRAQVVVADGHTYEGNGWRWVEAWEQAIANKPKHGTRLAHA